MLNFNFLASLCSWAGWFESQFVGNPEARFSYNTTAAEDNFLNKFFLTLEENLARLCMWIVCQQTVTWNIQLHWFINVETKSIAFLEDCHWFALFVGCWLLLLVVVVVVVVVLCVVVFCVRKRIRVETFRFNTWICYQSFSSGGDRSKV